MITHHTELLQALIDKYNLKSYLEIGVQNPTNNFTRIRCNHKFGVDPAIQPSKIIRCTGQLEENIRTRELHNITSDEYFDSEIHNKKFDLIFIDGDHTADQVKKDFENSLRCLSDNGFIVIHDCLPEKESTTHVPRDSKVWHGDVYKFCMTLRKYSRIDWKTFNIDNGCCLVWKAAKNRSMPDGIEFPWQSYLKHRKQFMNITDEVTI